MRLCVEGVRRGDMEDGVGGRERESERENRARARETLIGGRKSNTATER